MSTDGFSLSIHGATLDEFLDRFQAVAQRLGFLTPAEPTIEPPSVCETKEAPPVPAEVIREVDETGDYFPPSDAVGAKTALAALNGPVRRRPGRPARAASAVAASPEPPRSREPVEPSESPPVTLEDAKLAGREVIHTGGVDALRGLLTEFSIGRIGELKKDAWPRFIARCHEVAREVEPHA